MTINTVGAKGGNLVSGQASVGRRFLRLRLI